ncbi:MAG: DUF1015 domain-containing protein [Candidatus Omnitrophota bacterium]
MAIISPFAGLRFNPEKTKDLSRAISPPYDKITAAERAELWKRSERNVVRLILPPPGDKEIDTVTQSTDAESLDWYASAARLYQEWRKENILQTDLAQLYVYKQTFSYRGNAYNRTGLFGALQLGEQSGPRSHEYTFEGPKADRLRLLRAAKANLSPIFLIADGGRAEWDSIFSLAGERLIHFHDLDGQEHLLEGISGEKELRTAEEFLQRRELVIADGHHRYETAMNYCREMKEKTGKDPRREAWGSLLVLIVPIADPGLLVLPTHRVLSNMPNGWFDRLREKAAPDFDIEPIRQVSGEALRSALAGRNRSIAVLSRQDAAMFTLKSHAAPASMDAIPASLRDLNVAILHRHFFAACLDLPEEALREAVRYVRDEEEAADRVRQGASDAAFLLAGISPQTVFDVSLTGVRMPQKSTDFYPKIPTGLVLRSVE